MEFKLKQIGNVDKNCFIVHVEYNNANGCVDFKTHASHILDTKEISDLEKYIKSFNIIAAAIDRSKDDCEALDSEIEGAIENKMINNSYLKYIPIKDSNLHVVIEQDLTDEGEGDYTSYAGIRIKKIVFVDNDFQQFLVTF